MAVAVPTSPTVDAIPQALANLALAGDPVPSSRSPGAWIYDQTCRSVNKLLWRQAAEKSLDPPRLSDTDIVEIHRVIRRHKQNTDRLARIWKTGCRARFERTRDHYLVSFSTRLCAAVRAFAKKRRTPSLVELVEFSRLLNVDDSLSEPVQVTFKLKEKGGHRKIVKSGIRRMAQQFIIRDLLTATGVDSVFDYSRPGAGGEKALVGAVCEGILKGYEYWQTADIKNCFASLGQGHLKWLPVTQHLLRNVLLIPRCAKVEIRWTAAERQALLAESVGPSPIPYEDLHVSSTKELTKAIRREVRSGLPQGAVSSPLVARAFVGREIRAVLGPQVITGSFADDLFIGARTKQERQKALDAILSRLNGHPAGPLNLHIDKPTRATKHGGRVKVLGYNLEPGKGHNGKPIHVSPGPKRFDRFHRKTLDKWKVEPHPAGEDGLEEFISQRLDRWMPSQQAWDIVPDFSRNLALTVAVDYICEHDAE